MPVSDEERFAAARSYIAAVASHDADAVPFAADCTRVENGVKTGFSGNHLRRSLNRGLQYRVIAATEISELTANGDEVHAVFDVITKAAVAGRRVVARVDETFLIPVSDGRIHHIRASIKPRIQRQGW